MKTRQPEQINKYICYRCGKEITRVKDHYINEHEEELFDFLINHFNLAVIEDEELMRRCEGVGVPLIKGKVK